MLAPHGPGPRSASLENGRRPLPAATAGGPPACATVARASPARAAPGRQPWTNDLRAQRRLWFPGEADVGLSQVRADLRQPQPDAHLRSAWRPGPAFRPNIARVRAAFDRVLAVV